MNITADLIQRIEDYRKDNKFPCKNYASEAAAEKAANDMADKASKFYSIPRDSVRYIVFFNPAWGRWCAAFESAPLLKNGGYIGFIPQHNFYTY